MSAPRVEPDWFRLHLAMAKLASALGVELDPNRPDHELLEQLADRAVSRAVDAKINEPAPAYQVIGSVSVGGGGAVGAGGSGVCAGSLRCPCPACTSKGDA